MSKRKVAEKWESKSFPGVSAVLRHLTKAEQLRFRRMIKPTVVKIHKLGDGVKAAKGDSKTQDRLVKAMLGEGHRINRALVLAGLQELRLPKQCENIPEDIKPADLLLGYCPPELQIEIINRCAVSAGLPMLAA